MSDKDEFLRWLKRMLLDRENVGICRATDLSAVTSEEAGVLGAESVRPIQTVLDRGIRVDKDGNLYGNVG